MNPITFVIGGEKSGKSDYALKEGEKRPGKRAFLATALAIDEEMEKRIHMHKLERSKSWVTFEEPVKIVDLIEKIQDDFEVVLIDCLTIWVSNLMFYKIEMENEFERLIDMLSKKKTRFIIVSNEVGMGLVPSTEMGRTFRTQLGILNKKIAQISDRVVLMISGIPVEIKIPKRRDR